MRTGFGVSGIDEAELPRDWANTRPSPERSTRPARSGEAPYAARPPAAELRISPGRCVRVLGMIAALLVAASTSLQLYRYATGDAWLFGLVPRFYVDAENSIPTFFSGLLLAIGAGLLTYIAAHKRSVVDFYRGRWIALAAGFWYCAIDEAASLHELAIEPLRNVLGVGGILYFAWVIPAFFLVAAAGLYFRRFLSHFEPRVRTLMFTAAALFLGGALGVEMLGGWWADSRDTITLTFSLLSTLEESLELAGTLIFIYALLVYIQDWQGRLAIDFRRPRQRPPFAKG